MTKTERTAVLEGKEELLSPKIDTVFKRIFGGDKDIFIAFVNSIFADKNEELIESIEFINTELTSDAQDEKNARLDVLAKMANGGRINIEVQISPQRSFAKRSLFYWAKIYAGQLSSGESYKQLQKCICINILDFDFFKDYQGYHRVGRFIDPETREILSPELEVHFIEMTKLPKEVYNGGSDLMNWLLFLQKPNSEKLKELAMQNPILEKARETLQTVSNDPQERMLYEARFKALSDRATELEEAREDGEAKGRVEGEAKGRAEMAKKLKQAGVPLEIILQASGLSKEEIEKL